MPLNVEFVLPVVLPSSHSNSKIKRLIMSSVKAIIRKDKMNARGLAPVYLRTIRNRKAKYIRVDGVFVHPDDWDEKAECVKKSKRVSNYVRLNN